MFVIKFYKINQAAKTIFGRFDEIENIDESRLSRKYLGNVFERHFSYLVNTFIGPSEKPTMLRRSWEAFTLSTAQFKRSERTSTEFIFDQVKVNDHIVRGDLVMAI